MVDEEILRGFMLGADMRKDIKNIFPDVTDTQIEQVNSLMEKFMKNYNEIIFKMIKKELME